MKKSDLLMDQLENIIEKEQVNPSQVSDVHLESEYQRVRDWVNGLKTH
ncbi:hypothetical protein Golax_000896 [Gossypium laxum]|uniref:Uncharacterized protein n=1 Tax=Gossypium laxum TaxID=34288 RepID=A0A7J9AVC3_9ROSI|nr:hypothetical protein [Gossypium laxum]